MWRERRGQEEEERETGKMCGSVYQRNGRITERTVLYCISPTVHFGQSLWCSHSLISVPRVQHPDLVDKLFGPLKERYITRPGGYTRVLRMPNRRGDNASMAVVELVDNR